MKYLFLLACIGLYFSNPGLEEGMEEAKKRIIEDQSMIRASWSNISNLTGLDWIKKQSNLGTYEFCRKNYYLFSLYRVQNSKMLEDDKPIALGLGFANNIYGSRISKLEENKVLRPALEQANQYISNLKFSECKLFNKRGDLTSS